MRSKGPIGKPRKKIMQKRKISAKVGDEIPVGKGNPTKGGKIAGNWYKPKRTRSVKQ